MRFLVGAQVALVQTLFQAAAEAVVVVKEAHKSDPEEGSAVAARKSSQEELAVAVKSGVMVAAADGRLQVAKFRAADLRK